MSGDYHYLCCNCGTISPYASWTFLKRDDEDELVPVEPGDTDPICVCPSCAWHHTDDDSNPGVYDGTRLDMQRERKRLVNEGVEWAQSA